MSRAKTSLTALILALGACASAPDPEAEAQAEMDDKLKKARAEGAATEMARIKDVQAQTYPGHEGIVLAAMFDGESQAGDVAIQINAANLKAQKSAGEDLSNDAPAPLDEPANNGELSMTEGPQTEDQARKAWDKSVNLQKEFMSFEDFWAFSNKDSRFNVSVTGGAK